MTGEHPPLTLDAIQAALRTAKGDGPIGGEIAYYPQAGSTNDIVRQRASEGAREGLLVITDEQTAGRGRRQRRWDAPANSSLLMTALFRPTIHPAQAYRLVMVCGLGIAEGCAIAAGVPITMKWPNDLHINGKKVAGILPESSLTGDQLDWALVGMGVNVNQDMARDPYLSSIATSLRSTTGKMIDRAALLAQILKRINSWYKRIQSPQLALEWRYICATLGRRIEVKVGEGVLRGQAQTLDDEGALILQDEQGKMHRLTISEATLLSW
ncbi:MAG: biotin--[acetyl-CoA-carboxylase] ligase [Chloroflexi bacterium]|nr:biotin--[acetyl-CoA-carboxylase] ligase [Chloroflexota bacterium]